jgi:hypothetical protein
VKARLTPGVPHHRVINYRVAQAHVDRHKEVLSKFKKRGGMFKAAVERLERIFGEG